ncbi:NAD(P)-dependent oxidoreductase [Arthrobacter sulfonylureivorans]|uniref:NAD(P)-dependent oxidoreductase n=1 Tax=Arthrobacter sulfonylureivorans TaxID=2486855 RepID=UPI003BAF96FA
MVRRRPAGVVVDYSTTPSELHQLVREERGIRWVQLPTAGIEAFADSLAERPDVVWTSAKGAYAKPVAEHALALLLALLRDLPKRVVARSWAERSGRSLHGMNAVVVGAGGVAIETIRLLEVFDVNVTVVRRLPDPVSGASRTIGINELPGVLPDADVVILAASLTPATRGLFGAAEFSLMKESAVLVNIARGGLVDTDALVAALRQGAIAGAGLDVTDPEPLPDGHPLWDEPACLITPHSADTMDMIMPLYRSRIETNVQRFLNGHELDGLVDAEAGY